MKFTIIEAQNPSRLTKEFKRSPDGQLIKTATAYLANGTATTHQVTSMTDFATTILRLRNNEALVYGCCKHRRADVVSRDKWETLPDDAKDATVARTNDFFTYQDGPGIWMLDIDDDSEGNLVPQEKALSLLEENLPEADGVPRLLLPSASSHICDVETGKDLTGLSGYRIYIPVDDARAIPRLASVLHDRLLAAGHGYADITANGNVRIKSLHDMMVYAPCALDFASGAATGNGLEQRNREPTLINSEGPLLETSRVLLTKAVEQAAETEKADLKASAKARAVEIKAAWKKRQFQKLVSRGLSARSAKRVAERAAIGVLSGDFTLKVMSDLGAEPQEVTIVDILKDTTEFDGWYALHPLGTETASLQAYGLLLLNKKKPELSAFDSGEPTFQLVDSLDAVDPDLREIFIGDGQMSSAVDATIEAIASTGRFFNMGSALVDVMSGAPVALDVDQTAYVLGSVIEYSRNARANGELFPQRCDPPEKMCRQLLKHKRPLLPSLNAMVDRPMPRPDSSMIENAGYDKRTQLYV